MKRTLPPYAVALAAAVLLSACSTSSKDGCSYPSITCGGTCLDGGSDPSNCGACGHVCGAGTVCCNSACVDVHASDPRNCGACGRRCPTGAACDAGTCACPASDPTVCGQAPGTCVDLLTDPVNCGTCGDRCGTADVAVSDVQCTGASCRCAGTPASRDCGGTPPCVNTQVDEANCGTCGFACRSRSTCSGGACVCAGAYPDNCGTTVDPICVNRSADSSNCGACGHVCPATTVCSNSVCCGAGLTGCSGACVDTKTSAANCGSCGHACGAGQTCTSGACTCSGTTALACGTSCCAGTGCCPATNGTTTCQTAHSNGLNASPFYDCDASPYSDGNPWTKAAAAAAAASWSQGTTYDTIWLCDGPCVAQQTGNSCAVWCYAGSTFAGKVTWMATTSCTAVCNNFYGNVSVGTWQ